MFYVFWNLESDVDCLLMVHRVQQERLVILVPQDERECREILCVCKSVNLQCIYIVIMCNLLRVKKACKVQQEHLVNRENQ